MRKLTFFAAALVLAACGRSERPADSATTASQSATAYRGPDALVLRLPRAGGAARVVSYARPDSVIWSASERVPAIDHVLAFDDDGGTIAFVDSRGRAGWLDLRNGTVAMAGRGPIREPASLDGSEIFGIGANGSVVRYTEEGTWTFKPPRPARAVFPQPDGSAVVLASSSTSALAWRVHPPDEVPRDTVTLPVVAGAMHSQLGDRLYFVSDGKLLPLRTRTFELSEPLELEHHVRALGATPSGDRVFIISDSSLTLRVLDRFREDITDLAELPAQPSDLRMDPLGRYLLVREAGADTAWVLALGTGHVIGAVATSWRADLPFVGPDGTVALAQGPDVVMVDGETLREVRRTRGGTSEFWYQFLWDGYRPRASNLDQPAHFPGGDSAAADSAAAPDSTQPAGPPPQTEPTPGAPAPGPAKPTTFTLQFGAYLIEPPARELAGRLRVRGEAPRVVRGMRDGTAIYRVVLGPYANRDEAERIGRESGHDFWVFEGAP